MSDNGLGPAVWSLPLGAALDAWLGDPRGWPHPVRAIGWLIRETERLCLTPLASMEGRHGAVLRRISGLLMATAVISLTATLASAFILACDRLGPWGSLLGRTLLVYWGLAARSLGIEALRAAQAPDLAAARRELAMIVGRDTKDLDEPEICRACVETVAENCNDAVIAPLFWFSVGGPVALWAYKAVSTLDSMVGYRNARYRDYGWASARSDDLAALIPARLTWLLITLAALLRGESAREALRIGWRDGRKHPSPNAAWGEAAMAGALGIQLGGQATYQGVPSVKPFLGNPGDPIGPETVRRAVALMQTAAFLAVGLAWAARVWVLRAA
jgi:adenosylcobinamide-phosphate synthase